MEFLVLLAMRTVVLRENKKNKNKWSLYYGYILFFYASRKHKLLLLLSRLFIMIKKNYFVVFLAVAYTPPRFAHPTNALTRQIFVIR